MFSPCHRRPGGGDIYISSNKSPFKKALLTSSLENSMVLQTDNARQNKIIRWNIPT
jgi:hypothetical protein